MSSLFTHFSLRFHPPFEKGGIPACCLKAYYREHFPNRPLEEISVFGEVSVIFEAGFDAEKRREWGARRNRFWSKFGFLLDDPEEAYTNMHAKLADLKCVEGETQNGTEKYVDLSDFWELDHGPEVYLRDINTLLDLEVAAFREPEAVSIQRIQEFDIRAVKQSVWLGRFAFLLMTAAVIVLYSVLSIELWSSSLLLSLPIAYVLSNVLEYKVSQRLPAVRYAREIRWLRAAAISRIGQLIVELEEENNGFLWRIYPTIEADHPSGNIREMAETSRRGQYSILAKDHINVYEFLSLAKHKITAKNREQTKPVVG